MIIKYREIHSLVDIFIMFEHSLSLLLCVLLGLQLIHGLMNTTRTQIALGAMSHILLLLFLCFPYLSTAEVIYRPLDLYSINCGLSTNFSTFDGRNWIGDIKFLSESHDSVAAPALTPSARQVPYTSARLSHSQFSYSFPVTPGPKFLRLFFYSTLYQNFEPSKAYFSVKAGQHTLLQHFNASLNAGADDHPDNTFFREYCINLQNGQKLNITFTPSTEDSYAFINGIEIVSMPPYLYYTSPENNNGLPQLVGPTNEYKYRIHNDHALETTYRLNVAGREIAPSEDTGMLRSWDADNKYLTSQSGPSLDFGIAGAHDIELRFTNMTPNYTAPDQVYRSLRNMGPDASMNMRFNLTWQLPVDPGFTYLLRLHFCQLDPEINKAVDLKFKIFIQDQLATDGADVLLWTKQKGVPVVRDYAIYIPGNQEKARISLKMHPHPKSLTKDAQLNAIELFKITYPLLNPADPPPETPKVSLQSTKNGISRTLTALTGALSGVVSLSFVAAFFLIKRKNKKDEPSRGWGSSSLPTNLCRHFSIQEIKAATNNFDQLFLVGEGGFGNVYKGYIDNGLTRVAIKRLKPGSRQGVNEIEMLSQLRHLNLVSLIGYCYESKEMILVYDFMDRGTLRDHLYDTDNASLSWKQRLRICIGVARGLHYLHTGAKHVIIHRDVKSTNILLDEKWVARVSDFGLARIGPTGISMTHVNTEVKGSIGYLDPEYYKRNRLTEKSDVYSFGVVLLEVLSGRQPLLRCEDKQRVSLVNWAKRCHEMGNLREIVDPELKGQIAPECLRKFGEVALSCLLEDGTRRPSMNDVVRVLEFVLQLQDGVVNEVMESGGDYEDSRCTCLKDTPIILSYSEGRTSAPNQYSGVGEVPAKGTPTLKSGQSADINGN